MPPRLTFFVNTPDGKHEEIKSPGTHFDIAPTILALAGYNIEGQIGFGKPLTQGAGYLPGRFGETDWKKQSPNLMAVARTLWDNEAFLDRNGIQLAASDLILTFGGKEFDLHAGGIADDPATVLFVFNANSCKLEKIRVFALGQGLTRTTLGEELLKNPEKLALVISRAKNLPGFTDPRNNPDQWVYFCGKPGSNFFSWGQLTGDLLIPYDLIQKLNKAEIDKRVISEREHLLNNLTGNYNTK